MKPQSQLCRRRRVSLAGAGAGVNPREDSAQRELIKWVARNESRMPGLDMLYSIPMGRKRDAITARLLRLEGARRGVPDLCLAVARGGYFGLYLEMKRLRGGVLSPEQNWWKTRLLQEGYCVVVPQGLDAAVAALTTYLSLPQTRVPMIAFRLDAASDEVVLRDSTTGTGTEQAVA